MQADSADEVHQVRRQSERQIAFADFIVRRRLDLKVISLDFVEWLLGLLLVEERFLQLRLREV